MIAFQLDHFIESLPKDPSLDEYPRAVPEALYSFVNPKKTKSALKIHLNSSLLKSLGIDEDDPDLIQQLTGNTISDHHIPFAMNYGGHQFGYWAGQLGDGRAIHLGGIKINGNTTDLNWNTPSDWAQIQLKGAGPTPYSRSADGLAVLRSSIREYLCSEAMYHLGVPTTRALSLCLSGDLVNRDMLYNGNPGLEQGAIVARVAPNFIRFGSFELPSSRGEIATLTTLVKQTIKYYYPNIQGPLKEATIDFFKQVCENTAKVIADWQRVGFVHGVLNTDNMSVLGLTIDYGPYGWMEPYDLDWTPNTTDAKESRYRFGNQHQVGLWNLYQLANALYPIVEDAAPLEAALDHFKETYETTYAQMRKEKLGLHLSKDVALDALIEDLDPLLSLIETDMTLFYRELAFFKSAQFLEKIKTAELHSDSSNTKQANTIQTDLEKDNQWLFGSLINAFYDPTALNGTVKNKWVLWLRSYAEIRLAQKSPDQVVIEKMNAVNPKYVLRNYMAQMAIEAAEKKDYSIINELFQLLQKPYEEQHELDKWYAKRPEWARNKIGCSQLSCSS